MGCETKAAIGRRCLFVSDSAIGRSQNRLALHAWSRGEALPLHVDKGIQNQNHYPQYTYHHGWNIERISLSQEMFELGQLSSKCRGKTSDLPQTKASELFATMLLPDTDKAVKAADELWTWFTTTLEEAIKKFVPHRMSGRRERHPWISRVLRRLLRKEAKLFGKKKKCPSRQNISRHKKVQQQVQKKFRQEYWSYINGIFFPNEDSADPEEKKKTLWNYIKHCMKDSIGVAPLRNTSSGKLHSEPREKAELLNKQFQSVFSQNNPLCLKHLAERVARIVAPAPKASHYPTMPDFTIATNGIKKMLGTLKPHKAAGPDMIRPLILRDLRDTIAPILQVIFSRSMETGKLPRDWKVANVIPIFKKGSKHLPVNYRPVSLTCVCSKVMEHVIVSQVNRHLESLGILDRNQHGFRRGLSTETQLIDFIQELHTGTANGKQVDAVVMDFSKAFDKVAHNRLLYKIDKYGIQGKTAAWIKDFLSGKTQRVALEGQFSGEVPVTSGVPQGSVLGPLLFLLYINDISTNITSQIRLFADDTIIYRPVTSQADCEALQKDLHTLEKWSMDWQMDFHPAKCQTIHITRSRNPIHTTYSLYNQALEMVNSVKYLGINISADLRWNKHVDATRGAASATLGFLRRNLRISSQPVKTRAYQSYVRPKLEYASTVWDPHTKSNISKIEMVQRQSARWVLGRFHNRSSVTDMLSLLDWRTLEMRRADSRLMRLYKMRHGLVALDTTQYLQRPSGASASAHPHRYIRPPVANQLQANSFYPRSIAQWNALPADVALAPSLDTFKRRVCQVHH